MMSQGKGRTLSPAVRSGVGIEVQRDAVDAVAQTRWVWPIGEDMAQMSIAPIAVDFGAAHEPRIVLAFANHPIVHHIVEGGPAGPAFEFGRRIEQRDATTSTGEGARCFWEIVMGARALGSVLAHHFEAQIAKLLAPLGI